MKTMNCIGCGGRLVEKLTRKGVLVDYCEACGGIWLDKGEIFYFTADPAGLHIELENALRHAADSQRLNPKTGKPLKLLKLYDGALEIDYCPETEGVWLDAGEIERIRQFTSIEFVEMRKGSAFKRTIAQKVVLPSLSLASGVTMFLLYALLTLALVTLVTFGYLTADIALLVAVVFAIGQFLIGPFIMDFMLNWLYRVRWVDIRTTDPQLYEFAAKACAASNIPVPRFGIIPDGAPNAFTYGHTPSNARVVFTQGLYDLLEREELNAVVAHEIGHAVHWDMLIMTLANLVPMVFYYIYRTLIRSMGRSNSRNSKGAAPAFVIAIASYVIYIISEYIVLWLSRVREYYADRFAGYATGEPSHLASALVKIGYGLAGRENKEKKTERNDRVNSLKPLGIFDDRAARSLVIAASGRGGISLESIKGAMRWDLWNPWAAFYEFHSTHPLIAKRLLALGNQAITMDREPYITFDETRPESYWDDFFCDLLAMMAPVLAAVSGALVALAAGAFVPAGALMGLGAGLLLNFYYSYDFTFFPRLNIVSLLKTVKVSGVKPVACTLDGTIIGRGVPGLIYSEDFVMQDDSGIIFLDYRQPLAIWNFFFGLLRAGDYVNRRVTVTGWYRRAPVPYVEIKTLEVDGRRSNCYAYVMKQVFGALLIAAGLALMFVF